MNDWINKVTDYPAKYSDNALEYTVSAAEKMSSIIWNEDFLENDAEIIFDYLYNSMRLISFGDYLKRYIYVKAMIRDSFKDVPDKIYQDIILSEFTERHVPFSIRPTSTKARAIVGGWLKAETIRRESVFLLGFGLGMSVEDVSTFLTKALREQDFNYNDPSEVIYWFCIKNGFSFRRAMQFMEEYEKLEVCDEPGDYLDRTVIIREYARSLPEKELLSFLRQLKSVQREYPFSRTAREHFLLLLQEAKEEAAKIYKTYEELPDSATGADISDSSLEKIIYNGVPVDQRGNLMKASASKLKKQFADKRLTRQRIAAVSSGKMPVDRVDLITLFFFITAQRAENVLPNERLRSFTVEMNDLLNQCYMGELNISNSYEAFVLMCLVTDWPMATFSEVWELSYEGE